MTFDPSFYYQHGPIADDTGGGVTDEEALALLNGGTTKTNGQLVTLPDGRYVLLDPKTGRIIADYGSKPQTATAYAPATGGQTLANQQAMAALAQAQAQYDATRAFEKAKYNTDVSGHDALGNPTLAARLGLGNLDVSRGNLAVNQGNLGVSQGRLTLDQLKQQFDQYKALADLASNPRNYVQTFFMNRGFRAPPDVARYGNTNMNATNIMPFSQFQQMSAPAKPTQQAPLSAYPTGPLSTPPTAAGGGYASPYEGLSGFSKTGSPYRLSPNDPDAAGLMAKYPGMYQVTSQEEAMKYLPQPKTFAKGGVLQMMGPHAVVDLLTGRVKAIAGEAGPERAYFDGAAIIDPIMSDNPYDDGDFIGPTFGYPSAPTGEESAIPQGGSYNPYEPVPAPAPNYGGLPTTSTAPTQTWTQAQLQAMIDAANAGNQQLAQQPVDNFQVQPYAGTGYTQQPNLTPQIPMSPSLSPQMQTATAAPEPAPVIPQAPQPLASIVPQSVIQQPTAQPQTNYSTGETSYSPAAPVSNITPADVAPPGTFGGPIPPQMPSYLAGEDFQAQSPILAALMQSGAVPPFLKRLFAQGRGDPTQGTNTPQRTDLPPDLPLISELAWNQLSPSEQQAFLSYVSSLGVDPNDYLAMIKQFSPTGGVAQSPLFGNYAAFSRQ